MARRNTVPRPTTPNYDTGRFEECRLAVEDGVLQLLGDAVEAGWSQDEVLAATISVADETAIAMHENMLISVETEQRKWRKKKGKGR